MYALHDSFGSKVTDRRFRWTTEYSGQPIGHDPVDFLRHAPVEGTQSGFDMNERNTQLGGNQRAGQRTVRIAVHHQPIGQRPLHQQGFEAHHRLAGLHGVGAGPRSEVRIGIGQAQLLEKNGAHFRIVMLPGMHQRFPECQHP